MRTRLLGQIMPTLYQNIAIALVLVGMGGVYLAGSSGVADLGAVVLILVRALSYSQQMQSSYHSLVETGARTSRSSRSARRSTRRRSSPEGGAGGRPHRPDRASTTSGSRTGPASRCSRACRSTSSRARRSASSGPSGSGKSTLVQLLLRLREPGRRALHGRRRATPPRSRSTRWYRPHDVRPAGARACSGARSPTTSASSATTSTDEAVEQAAKLAHLHDDIVGWPEGLRHAGRRAWRRVSRRAAPAHRAGPGAGRGARRADPRRADQRARHEVRVAACRRRSRGSRARSTMFIIAHRLSTLNVCDRIMVLKDGELQAFDASAALRESNEFFSEAVRLSQLRIAPRSRARCGAASPSGALRWCCCTPFRTPGGSRSGGSEELDVAHRQAPVGERAASGLGCGFDGAPGEDRTLARAWGRAGRSWDGRSCAVPMT